VEDTQAAASAPHSSKLELRSAMYKGRSRRQRAGAISLPMPLLAPVTSASQFSMTPKVPAKPARWQAVATFQPVRMPNFAERTVAPRNPVTKHQARIAAVLASM